ncbi:hypothetical protein ACHAWU_006861 [Discostella pseudostelligera]|uniref:Ubiquitin-like protein ATG12 n=1 Tax=Discostella pseudostelligera TaxID=259834 RepID=A0ABD3MY00_9STRA
MPNDDETIKATSLTTDEGGEAIATSTSALSPETDPSPGHYIAAKDDAPPKTTDDDPPSLDSEKDSLPSRESSSSNNKTKSEKIKVHLVAVGSAPILKKSKFLMNADDRFAVAIAFLRKVLKLSSSSTTSSVSNTTGMKASSLFLYVNAAFVPSPDERIGDLFDCFGSRGELVIHYSLQEAWG